MIMKIDFKTFLQPSFLICVTILAIAGGGKAFIITQMGIRFTKLPIPLQKSLDLLDVDLLSPYKVVHKSKIENKDVLEQLGTEDYIEWVLEDTTVEKSSPVRYCSLFITYYTGNPDRVPHIPDECHVGAGSQRMGRETVSLDVKGLLPDIGADAPMTLDARYVNFARGQGGLWDSSSNYSVLYFFKTNGKYAASRGETRKILGQNFVDKYSYFSKFEW